MKNRQNIYNQKIYGKEIKSSNYGVPSGQGQIVQQQIIKYGQNQPTDSRNKFNQGLKPLVKINKLPQITIIPQIQQNIYHQNNHNNLYQQVPQQFIYQQVPLKNNYQIIPIKNIQQNQYQNINQQNQYKNNYQQQMISNQEMEKSKMIKQQEVIQYPNIQELNKPEKYIQKNTNISQNQVDYISNNSEHSLIKKQGLLDGRAKPMTKEEIDDLYSNASAICKIKFKYIKNGNIHEGIGTGFFCEIDDDNIPFRHALFTNNHILKKEIIGINTEIIFEICNILYKIIITKNRKVFTNENLDYTCIEILKEDHINKYFRIDDNIFNNKNMLKDKEIFVLQYANGILSHDSGRIIYIKDDIIRHSVGTEKGSSGAPLIKRYNNNLIIGMHYGARCDNKSKDKYLYNLAIPFDILLNDIKIQLNNNIINNNNEYRNIINLIYEKIDFVSNNILGSKFVKNNKDNIQLIINGKEEKLCEYYELKDGLNNIRLIILKTLKNLGGMFSDVHNLKNIDELKYLNTKEVNNFSGMFYGCSSLSDIKPLQNWNVSDGNDFSFMFSGCSSLSDIKPLQNWNISNGKDFSYMFYGCSSLSDIKPLQNWNVSNGKNFAYMFYKCLFLTDIKPLQNWNVSNGKNFSYIFYKCSSLTDIKPLKNWNVANGNNFSFMFYECSSLSDIKPLQNWNVSNGKNFSFMFYECSSLSDIKPLQNWNVSDGNNFACMFSGCSFLTDIKPLKNWNVSNGKDFSSMFKECLSLKDIKPLQNWNVSKSKLENIF